MEGLVFLAVIFLFSIPVLWIIVLSRRGGGDLRPRLDALEQRVAALRVTIDRLAASAPAPPAAPVPEQAADTAAPPLPAAPPEVTASPPPHPTMPPEAAAPAPSRPSVSAPTAAVPRPPREGWEQQIMRRWAVWLGALALALGGVFLVNTRSSKASSGRRRASSPGVSSGSPSSPRANGRGGGRSPPPRSAGCRPTMCRRRWLPPAPWFSSPASMADMPSTTC